MKSEDELENFSAKIENLWDSMIDFHTKRQNKAFQRFTENNEVGAEWTIIGSGSMAPQQSNLLCRSRFVVDKMVGRRKVRLGGEEDRLFGSARADFEFRDQQKSLSKKRNHFEIRGRFPDFFLLAFGEFLRPPRTSLKRRLASK
jgi:hypothetical protein